VYTHCWCQNYARNKWVTRVIFRYIAIFLIKFLMKPIYDDKKKLFVRHYEPRLLINCHIFSLERKLWYNIGLWYFKNSRFHFSGTYFTVNVSLSFRACGLALTRHIIRRSIIFTVVTFFFSLMNCPTVPKSIHIQCCFNDWVNF